MTRADKIRLQPPSDGTETSEAQELLVVCKPRFNRKKKIVLRCKYSDMAIYYAVGRLDGETPRAEIGTGSWNGTLSL